MFEKHCLVAVYTASPVLLHILFVVATSPFENNIICNYKLQNQQKLIIYFRFCFINFWFQMLLLLLIDVISMLLVWPEWINLSFSQFLSWYKQRESLLRSILALCNEWGKVDLFIYLVFVVLIIYHDWVFPDIVCFWHAV